MTTNRDDDALDPICGRRVDDGAHAIEYRQRRYAFCSASCKERFRRQIERDRLQDLARLGALFATDRVHWGVA
jgi:YHS domain-containing protein